LVIMDISRDSTRFAAVARHYCSRPFDRPT
jgi:hypothetical protein